MVEDRIRRGVARKVVLMLLVASLSALTIAPARADACTDDCDYYFVVNSNGCNQVHGWSITACDAALFDCEDKSGFGDPYCESDWGACMNQALGDYQACMGAAYGTYLACIAGC